MRIFYDIKGSDKRNWTKLRCLYALAHNQTNIPGTNRKGLSPRLLANLTGVSIGSIYVLSKRWYKWGYIKWERIDNGERLLSYFGIAPRGDAYLASAYNWYPLMDQVAEVVRSGVEEYMRIKAWMRATALGRN